MDNQKTKNNSAALYNYSAADFNLELLEKISLQDLTFLINNSKDERAEFRAAWALEHILLKNKELLIQQKNEIIQIFLNTKNWSVQRSISKIIMDLLKNPTKYLFDLDEELKGLLLDKSFKILEDKECPIAVRCNVYDIVFLAGKEEKWVLSELKTQIYFDLEKSSTPALLSRGGKLLKRISKA